MFFVLLFTFSLFLLQCAGLAWIGIFLYARHVCRRIRASSGNLILRDDMAILSRDFTFVCHTPAIFSCPICGEEGAAVQLDQYHHEQSGMVIGLLAHRCHQLHSDDTVTPPLQEVSL